MNRTRAVCSAVAIDQHRKTPNYEPGNEVHVYMGTRSGINAPGRHIRMSDNVHDNAHMPQVVPNTARSHENAGFQPLLYAQQAQNLAPAAYNDGYLPANNDQIAEENMLIDYNHAMSKHTTAFDGIVAPTTVEDRRMLIQTFRNEVLLDEVRDLAGEYGLGAIPVDTHDLDLLEQLEVIELWGHLEFFPHMVVSDIRRHDWNRQGDSIYSVTVDGWHYRGNALYLQKRLYGVRRALWEFWADRPAVHGDNIEYYVYNYGVHGFYQAMMWHGLTENRWLELWYTRRASRRG
ncbi:hypothetical protein QFC19_000001 [Naganishia cerealis]|uniref:Uncharacterized protein n=1 Tax=Naganishia cerealis TaxID=610337 RepID=A0ACC2WQU1_9TREE|nr:hypothetical protein QFC19_000001 [Naganishia cerealis]